MTYSTYPADPDGQTADPFRNLDPAPQTRSTLVIDPGPDARDERVDPPPLTLEDIAERQHEAFGGPKVGAAFFGVLLAAATGTLLIAALVVADAALGLGVIPDPWASGGIGPLDAVAVGWVVVGLLLAFVLVAAYCGGYVAGRMARFSGIAQGLAVWVWAIVLLVAAGVAAVLLDGRYGLAAAAGALPTLPVPDGSLVLAGIVAAVAVAVVALGGAVLGGVVGVRYHRRVDRVGTEG
ncbi:hypothetical protein GCM10009819_05250 [Agromyces tropicus]|uniref:Uncharacterized protein n=1 Tax=Agromyces tropicus TaxID=555371 RepID=A0ABP5FGI1_9MICO